MAGALGSPFRSQTICSMPREPPRKPARRSVKTPSAEKRRLFLFWASSNPANRLAPWLTGLPRGLICLLKKLSYCGLWPDLSSSGANNWIGLMTLSNQTPLLDRVPDPQALRTLPRQDLRQLADELRQELINVVSVTGGHLGAGLGVVELTVALHYVFDTPADRLIWDVGHQAYPHKILTGRRSRMRTLRQGGGLSGFTKRAESEYDPFGAAHSSTSISSALGMAVARDLKGDSQNVIAVIGDGAMSAGMGYEAMNNAGAMDSRLIVILNDNEMSIAPPVGALSAYLARLLSGRTYTSLREIGKQIAKHMPK